MKLAFFDDFKLGVIASAADFVRIWGVTLLLLVALYAAGWFDRLLADCVVGPTITCSG
jgi:hypothetical protein